MVVGETGRIQELGGLATWLHVWESTDRARMAPGTREACAQCLSLAIPKQQQVTSNSSGGGVHCQGTSIWYPVRASYSVTPLKWRDVEPTWGKAGGEGRPVPSTKLL